MAHRNYRKEYDTYHSSSGQKKARATRNAARRKALRDKLVAKGDGREVDHRVPLSKGGSNGSDNTRVVSRETNRKKGARSV